MPAGQRLLGSWLTPAGKEDEQRTSSKTGCPKGNIHGVVPCSWGLNSVKRAPQGRKVSGWKLGHL